MLVASGGDGGGGGDAPEDVATIEIEPNSAMLVASGDAAQLRAVAYDAAGNELDVKVEWSIDDASVVSIDGGKVVALTGEAASTRAHASVGDVSASSLVYIAKPAPNAVTYSGDQVTRAPEVVGAPEALLGMQVRVGDPDGTNDTLMFTAASIGATDVYPRTWTSDGSKLVVDTDVGCQLASEGAAPTAAPFPCDTGVHLAPDDSKITRIVGGTGSITVYDFATGAVTTVIDATDFPGAMSFQNSGSAGFSQDGSQLAIGVDLDGQRDVYVVNTDGSGTPVAVGTSAEIDVPSSGRAGAIWR